MTTRPAALEIFLEDRQKRVRISGPRLIRWVKKVLKALGWRRASLSLALVSDAEIRRLNQRYLKEDRATDVLAFGQKRGRRFGPKKPFLGDVVASVETARRAGPEYGNPWDEELLLYISHGILHLMGYRDSTPRLKVRMDRRQRGILRKVLGRKWQSKKRKPLF